MASFKKSISSKICFVILSKFEYIGDKNIK